jgi:hypothetical protein
MTVNDAEFMFGRQFLAGVCQHLFRRVHPVFWLQVKSPLAVNIETPALHRVAMSLGVFRTRVYFSSPI